MDRLQVKAFAGHLKPPQMRLQASIRVEDVGDDLIETGGHRPPYVELVRPPVGRQGGVEAVGQELRAARSLRVVDGLVGEPCAPLGLAGVGPAPSQRRAEPGPVGVIRGAGQDVVDLGRHLSGVDAEQLDGRRPEHSSGPVNEIALVAAAAHGFVVQAGGRLPSTGRAFGIGSVEQHADGVRPDHHA